MPRIPVRRESTSGRRPYDDDDDGDDGEANDIERRWWAAATSVHSRRVFTRHRSVASRIPPSAMQSSLSLSLLLLFAFSLSLAVLRLADARLVRSLMDHLLLLLLFLDATVCLPPLDGTPYSDLVSLSLSFSFSLFLFFSTPFYHT